MKAIFSRPEPEKDTSAKIPLYAIPLHFKKILMPRISIMPAHGPISSLLNIWARLPYAEGSMRTGFNPYRTEAAVRRDEKYSKVSTTPYVWNGCAEAMVENLGVFTSSTEHPSVSNDDMESLVDNSPLLKFLSKNHCINIKKNSDNKEYTLRSGWIRSVNPVGYVAKQKCEHIPNLVPVTKTGFFFIPRSFTDKLVPGYFKKKNRNDYEKYGQEFTCTDAYYDLYCHCCYNDDMVLGSQLGGIVSFGDYNPVVTYAQLAERWGWSKAKVSRFFKAWSSLITVFSLGSNRGSVIYINRFVTEQVSSGDFENTELKHFIPTSEQIKALFIDAPDELDEKNAYVRRYDSPISVSTQISEVIGSIMEKVGMSTEIYDNILWRLTNCFLKSTPRFKRVSRPKNVQYGIYTPPGFSDGISLISLGCPVFSG